MDVQGTVAAGFEPVREVFADAVAASPGTGAAFAAWHDGAWVADLWGGYADRDPGTDLENAVRGVLGLDPV